MALNETGQQTINDMISGGLIPMQGNFIIDERLLYEYMVLYNFNCKGDLTAKHNQLPSNRFYTRKMAGLTLLKEKVSRGYSAKNSAEGFVYFISNPAWPKHTKVGLAFDVKSRLSTYQTYDPFRSFKIEAYEFVVDRKEWEQYLLNKYQVNSDRGEWIPHTKYFKMVDDVRERIRSSLEDYDKIIARSSNGRTKAFDSFNRGSNPRRASRIVTVSQYK